MGESKCPQYFSWFPYHCGLRLSLAKRIINSTFDVLWMREVKRSFPHRHSRRQYKSVLTSPRVKVEEENLVSLEHVLVGDFAPVFEVLERLIKMSHESVMLEGRHLVRIRALGVIPQVPLTREIPEWVERIESVKTQRSFCRR